MNAFLSYLRLMLSLLPDIIALVRAIEAHAGDASRAGSSKLDLLKALITDVWSALEPAAREQISIDALVGVAVKIANRFVAFFNAVGLFKTSAKPVGQVSPGLVGS